MAAIAIHFMHYNFARPHKAVSLAQEDGSRDQADAGDGRRHRGPVWAAKEIVRPADPN